MPRAPKRETGSDTSYSSPNKKKVYTQWSAAEEAEFLSAINAVLSSHLWPTAKQSDLLAQRGAGGVNKHWQAMYKRMIAKKP